jgi:hypothetical protein
MTNHSIRFGIVLGRRLLTGQQKMPIQALQTM